MAAAQVGKLIKGRCVLVGACWGGNRGPSRELIDHWGLLLGSRGAPSHQDPHTMLGWGRVGPVAKGAVVVSTEEGGVHRGGSGGGWWPSPGA